MRISLNSFAFVVLLLFTITADLRLGCIEKESQALLNFKRSLHSVFEADPSSPPILPSWEGHECCQWEGIACNNVTGHVVKIEISRSCVPCISSWDDTADIEPKYDDLLPDFPIKFFGSMQQLRYLSLWTEFEGMIPSSIGNLTNLHVLQIASFHEAYSDDLSWVAQLSSLQYLGFYRDDLSKANNLFQVLNMLPSLSQIHLFDCGLGRMPIPLHPINLMNLTNVQVPNLACNNLKDPLNKLVGLYLGGNRFSGRFLPNPQNMTTGDFDSSNTNLCSNRFVHNVQNMTFMSFIRDFDLSNSNLCSVPSWLSRCKSIEK
ncbi:hypothetical protein PIB30_092236 [Stylosanthes scabra]|uniref:Leucine-rich repeat-containing N-terminal plant-type domain-containing protein n=1 Tax=Stylosanthes scabra TaxID=79078 RepID=A0ABU6ZTE7_9FABA|nr:hypothetical protein [Stylosanthes scabra]